MAELVGFYARTKLILRGLVQFKGRQSIGTGTLRQQNVIHTVGLERSASEADSVFRRPDLTSHGGASR
jgi:hypothetical protein